MLTTIWIKIQSWVIAFGVILAAIAGAVLYGRRKGEVAVQNKVDVQQAQQKVNTAEAIVTRTETRTDVDNEVAALPSNPVGKPTVPAPLPVPGSAADQLQSEWSRD